MSPPDRLERELKRTRRDYRQLFEIVPCYITVQEPDFRIVESNAMFGRDFGDRIGEHCHRAYKGRDGICPGCPVEKTFADGEVHSSEETVVTPDGRQIHLIVYSMPVHDDEGHVTSVMEVSTNITEVKHLQRQLALMGIAVAGMAHRIKNILMGLEGGIFVVNTGFETGDQTAVADGWQMVQNNVTRVSRLVKDLLYCSKQQPPAFQDGVSPAEIVRATFELFRARMQTEGIRFTLELGPDVKPGRFDRKGLENVVENLLSNAVDACRFDFAEDRREHAVTLRCLPQGPDAVAIEVVDDGVGIPDDAQHRVFENFFSTKGTEGTGLGLLVVQKVVSEHGGSVTFASRQGEGTTFRAVLPYAR